MSANPLKGQDGFEYYTVTGAAKALNLNPATIYNRIKKGEIKPVPAHAIGFPKSGRRGRRAQIVIPATIVNEIVDLVGSKDLDPRDSTTSEAALSLISALETENSRLREKVASLEEVVRLSLVVDGGRIDQLRLMLTESSPND